MNTSQIQQYCKLDRECTEILRSASEKYGYSARVIHKLLRLARTAADLDASDVIQREHVVLALGCRDLDVSTSQMYAIR